MFIGGKVNTLGSAVRGDDANDDDPALPTGDRGVMPPNGEVGLKGLKSGSVGESVLVVLNIAARDNNPSSLTEHSPRSRSILRVLLVIEPARGSNEAEAVSLTWSDI